MENLEQIKKAIEIEVKYKYININGRTGSFSSFICRELRKKIKSSENPKWQVLLEHFGRYQMDTLPQRKKSLERLVSVIRAEQNPEPEQKEERKTTLKSDVMYLKGVGPKVADCILLFGLGKYDVFPVDTWIDKVYHEDFHGTETRRNRIADYFVSTFGTDSGYCQQYLFYYKRKNITLI